MPRIKRGWTQETKCPTLNCSYVFPSYYATWTYKKIPFTKCPKCGAYIDTPLKPRARDDPTRKWTVKVLKDTDDMPMGKYGPNKGDHRMMMDIPASYFHYLWTHPITPLCLAANVHPVANYVARNLERLKKEHPGTWMPTTRIHRVNRALDIMAHLDNAEIARKRGSRVWKKKPAATASG